MRFVEPPWMADSTTPDASSTDTASELELRRISAQEGIKRLISDVQYIFDLLERMRYEVATSQTQRLG